MSCDMVHEKNIGHHCNNVYILHEGITAGCLKKLFTVLFGISRKTNESRFKRVAWYQYVPAIVINVKISRVKSCLIWLTRTGSHNLDLGLNKTPQAYK